MAVNKLLQNIRDENQYGQNEHFNYTLKHL